MPSAGNRIIDTLFGCCLGNRNQSGAYTGGGARGAGGQAAQDESDERAPLMGGRPPLGGDAANGVREGHAEQNLLSGTAKSREKSIDVTKLRDIRDQANNAFFYVDSSQLLPSSSSSRPLNANLSQGMGGASKRGDQKRSGSSQQDVIVQSDKAERLYKAAISSPTSSANQLSPPDKEAPVSLVRQMQVSIREAAKHGGGGSGEQGDTKTSERRKGPSASPQEAHGSMGFDAASEEQQRTLGKLPSLHSLRTLRLSAQSLGSPSLSELEKDSSLEGRFGGEDEEWSQRGRTRSKRGLAWIDSGPSKDARQLQGKARLEGLFNEEGQASGIEADQAGGGADEIDEVPNALRLTAKESATMREVQERLKATSTIAEVWDAGQDN